MITHSITVYHKPIQEPGNFSHRERIFERTLAKLDQSVFYEGGTYITSRSKEKGTLIYICQKIQEVEWDGLKVKLLELWFPDSQTTHLFHPSDLKEIKHA